MPPDLRFHLDECVDRAVAEGLRRRGMDVTTSHEAGLRGLTDRDQLAFALRAFALREGRVLVTQDSDFLKLTSEGVPHNGLAYYLPGSRSIGELISMLVLMSELLTSEECPGMV